jgi:hypothetical protein
VHTAKLVLLGEYVAENFGLAADGHGGTRVNDPPVDSSGHLVTPHQGYPASKSSREM